MVELKNSDQVAEIQLEDSELRQSGKLEEEISTLQVLLEEAQSLAEERLDQLNRRSSKPG